MTENVNDPTVLSSAREERIGTVDTIYSAPMGSVIWRNIVAGASRALGAVIIQTVGILVLLALFQAFVAPQLEPILRLFQRSTASIERLQQTLQSQQDTLEDARKSTPQLNQLFENSGIFGN